MTRPNSDPSFFLPYTWTKQAPEILEWAKAHSLHMEMCYYRHGWDVWMPLQELEGRAAAESIRDLDPTQFIGDTK